MSPYSFSFNIRTDSSSGKFGPKTDYNAGNLSYYGCISDIDNDSDIDIITSNWGDNSISIFKNNGVGSFPLKTDYKTAYHPSLIFANDINNDSYVDLILVAADTLSIFINLGNGNFSQRTDYAIKDLFSIYINDIDGDGDNDILVNAGKFIELRNDGNGKFNDKIKYNSLFVSEISDIDLDGVDDFISYSWPDSKLSVFKNLGNIVLSNIGQYPASSSVDKIFSFDIDNDNDIDLITMNEWDNSVSVFKNNGDGTYATKTDYPTGNLPNDISIIDIDGDNDGDIVTTCTNSNNISVLKNNGNGTFATKIEYPGNNPSEVFVCDINKDGVIDIVTINGNSNTFSILFGYKAPKVSTQTITGINSTSVTINGKIEKVGVPNITQHGFCWNTIGNPNINDSKSQLGIASAQGNFTSNITGLIPNTTYLIKAFAINEEDTAFGEEISFKTPLVNVSITGSFSVKNKIYDGNVSAEMSLDNLSLTGVLSIYPNVSISNLIIEFADKNVGTSKIVSVISAALSGSDKDKYELSLTSLPTSIANVILKELTITGASVSTKVYDGTTNATISGATLNGVITGDDVDISNNSIGAFDNKKSVPVKILILT